MLTDYVNIELMKNANVDIFREFFSFFSAETSGPLCNFVFTTIQVSNSSMCDSQNSHNKCSFFCGKIPMRQP